MYKDTPLWFGVVLNIWFFVGTFCPVGEEANKKC